MHDLIKKQVQDLPNEPGVYQMMDAHSIVIYVGKAGHIKKRVSQYFSNSQKDYKTAILVEHIRYIKPIITKNDHEALILEAQLIKHLRPRFNVLLKDDKSYPYIKITTNEHFPRIIITRLKSNDQALYFGPYTSYGSSRKLRNLLYDVFPLRDCTQHIDPVTTQKKCIKLDIGKCIGPCIYKHITDEYQQIVRYCIHFLSGKDDSVIRSLNTEMACLSSNKQFEKAAIIRDKIQQLQKLQQQRKLELDTNHDHYFISYSSNDTYHYFIAQNFRNKQFISQYGTYLDRSISFDEFLEQALIHILCHLPHKKSIIICDQSLQAPITKIKDCLNLNLLYIHTPTKGIKHAVLTLVKMNAKKSLIGLSNADMKKQEPDPLLLLKKELHLMRVPSIIFGCDISHFYGTKIVGSVVVFIDGKPSKQYYRHFNIETVTSGKSDDTKSIKETVLRILTHYSFSPDLLLIDGGKGQLNAALSALKQSKEHDIFCISLAKKNEDIYHPHYKDPIRLSSHHSGLTLLRYVRDESHRFALKFQRRHRTKAIQSDLLQIHGLGEKRIKNLYKHFKSFDNIRKASTKEISGVDQINEKLAKQVFQFFNP